MFREYCSVWEVHNLKEADREGHLVKGGGERNIASPWQYAYINGLQKIFMVESI